MIKLSKETRLKASDVLDRAKRYFGPGGLDMDVVDMGACAIGFERGGGHVVVTVADAAEERPADVTITSREFETQARAFLTRI